MKRIIFILLILLSGELYASQYKNGSFTAFSDVLVWRVREATADNWSQQISPDTLAYRPIKLYDAPFNWNAGFRLGFGFQPKDTAWDVVLYLTRFQTKANNQVAGQIYSAYTGNFYVNNTDGVNFGPSYGNAALTWKFLFYTLDAEAGHTFTVDSVLKLRPFLGLKTALINQDIETSWFNPIGVTNFTSANENLTNDFWGIGPSLGLDTTWSVYQSVKNTVNLFGNFSGAMLWGHWHFRDRYGNNAPMVVNVKVDNVNGGAPMTRALVGIEWLTQLAKADLAVRLGYEAQVWFDQLQFYSFNMGRTNHLMSLQGGVLDFTFKFD